ncbi:MAG: CtsR family transcriptional regulator [Oscillospiraceae bacterium]|jgi:transcriptional regulator CtsR|nr:CtsR family transcriptional regulator [Oscillospiraceae bacterium]
MNISSSIAAMIAGMLEASGSADIQRNTLAQEFGCSPSQINYVIASRFTPEMGYLVESRRGGGGFVRITRIHLEPEEVLSQAVTKAGNAMDASSCRMYIDNLRSLGILQEREAALLFAATGDTTLRQIPAGQMRDSVRAAIFKKMLLTMRN